MAKKRAAAGNPPGGTAANLGFEAKHLQDNAKQPTIGKLVDDAMVAIERDNLRLKGILPKDYARPAHDKHRLGELTSNGAQT